MTWLSNLISKSDKKDDEVITSEIPVSTEHDLSPKNYAFPGQYNNMYPIHTVGFDGEKTPGELGAIHKIIPDHNKLRLRAYEAEIKKDVVKIITGKFFKWVVGSGLKLQAEPSEEVLKSEGVNVEDFTNFKTTIEKRFSLFCNSERSGYTEDKSIHELAADAFKASFLGGDCLVICRVTEGKLNVQVVDGEQVSTPFFDADDSVNYIEEAKRRGNRIEHGIELDKKGKHIAYYVYSNDQDKMFGKFERVLAKGPKTGRQMAWMIYGDKHRIDHLRGIPAITSILEKVEKLDRYTEATVGGAEERAKIAYSVEHNRDSDGSNPLADRMKAAMGSTPTTPDSPTEGFAAGELAAKNIAKSTSKTVFNMPIGSQLKSMASTLEIQYEPFWKAIFYSLCAAVEVPPEVALQSYNSNYSASRAAINAWGFIVGIYRDKHAKKFYQKIYNLQLELDVLHNKVEAPQYIKLLREKNHFAVEAYSKARFVGSNMPHIDPLKEVKAINEMITSNLICREQGAEMLNVGDWNENFKKILEESKLLKKNDTDKESTGEQK